MAPTGEWSVPGYSEVRELGSGGGGRVVLATHTPSGNQVAIKYLADRLRAAPGFLPRFQQEARLMVELRDPNVARLFEYFQTPHGAAIVMELVNGVPLRALLRDHGATGPEAALVVLKGSLLGLAGAHRMGVVHRDYKPENVLVQPDATSKLVDFGIALRSGDGGTAEGTPPYMAPEQWSGRPASPATDVYAATAVFFECLTGHRPYQATAQIVLRFQHEHAPVPLDEVPEPIRALVAMGLAKDPRERPGTASAFVAELEQVALAAYGEEWEERGRRRLAALVALLALLLPVRQPPPAGGTTLFHTTLGSLKRAARGNAKRLAAGAGVLVVAAGTAAYVLAAERPPVSKIGIVAAGPSETPFVPSPAVLLPPAETSPAAEETPPAGEGVPEGTGEPTLPETDPPGSAAPPASTAPSSPSPSPTTGPPTTRPPTTPPVTPTPPTRVQDMRIESLTVGRAPGRTLRASVSVTTTGTARVALNADILAAGRTVATRSATLAGATSYTHRLTYSFAERPCGTTVGFRITAGGQTTTRQARVTCPVSVGTVDVLRAAVNARGRATATVAVTTSDPRPVRLSVALRLGRQVVVRSVTLSGQTSYITTVSVPAGRASCGTAWRVTATTSPRAGNGADAFGGRTAACPERPTEPTEKPTEKPTEPPNEQPTVKPTPRPNETPTESGPTTEAPQIQ